MSDATTSIRERLYELDDAAANLPAGEEANRILFELIRVALNLAGVVDGLERLIASRTDHLV